MRERACDCVTGAVQELEISYSVSQSVESNYYSSLGKACALPRADYVILLEDFN